jgi:phosphoserine phosphatase RsbU/P
MSVDPFVSLKNLYRFERVHVSLAAFALSFFLGYEQLMTFFD